MAEAGGQQPRPVGATYHPYSQGAEQYTSAKMRVQLPTASTLGAQLCFTLRANICPTMQRLCAGSSCMFSLAQDVNARNNCCPVATRKLWQAR